MQDTQLLKLSWKFEIESEVKVDTNYSLGIQGTIVSSNKVSNQDGSYTFIHMFRPIRWVVSSEDWESIKAKDNRKNSQKLRSYLTYAWSQDSKGYNTSEEYYDAFYRQIYKNMDFINSQIG